MYSIKNIDGVEGILQLPDKSVKLVYGSPPYPNAKRNYGFWSSDNYLDFIVPFIQASIPKLTDDGFIVLCIKANRESKKGAKSTRSFIVEKLAIMMSEQFGLNCVDIEIWNKSNYAPTGLRAACQDSYEQILWFAKDPNWEINLDRIRKPYAKASLDAYNRRLYHPRSNGLGYFGKSKHICPNPLGALPNNVVTGPISMFRSKHQAAQPEYLPNRYILACTEEKDIVIDPWVGTGTTGVQAVKNNRNFYGFDTNPEYVKISIDRIESLN